jgi:hypothetical protein
MAFKYGIKLPGKNKKIWVKEITSKLYRDLVKSLYNNDTTEFLQHLSYIIEYVYPGIIQEDLNVVDKVIILLHTRSICINPDLKLKAKCPKTDKEFECTVRIEDLIGRLENINYTRAVKQDNVEVVHTIAKVKDEFQFIDISDERYFSTQLASSIDSITVNDQSLLFKDLTFEERLEIIEKLPLVLAAKVYESIISVETELSLIKLLTVRSPFTGDYIVDLPVSTDVKTLLEFCKLIFNDDLGNLYRIAFNLINKGNFTPDYVEQITPAEQLLYWNYVIQQNQKEQEAYDSAQKSNNSSTPNYGGQQIGKETPSEFT